MKLKIERYRNSEESNLVCNKLRTLSPLQFYRTKIQWHSIQTILDFINILYGYSHKEIIHINHLYKKQLVVVYVPGSI